MLVKKNHKKSATCVISAFPLLPLGGEAREEQTAKTEVKNDQLKKKVSLTNNTKESSCFFITKKTLLKNNNLKLTVLLTCYSPQVKDIYFTINTIEKLIHYLNLIYAKSGGLSSALYPKRGLYLALLGESPGLPFVFAQRNRANPTFTPLEKAFPSEEREGQKVKGSLPRFARQKQIGGNVKQLNWYFSMVDQVTKKKRPNSKSNISNSKLLEYYNYFNRFFFKCSKCLSGTHPIKGHLSQKKPNKQTITVTRAPFVFKKTREQFGLQKLIYHMAISLASPAQKNSLIQNLRLLKLPVEIRLIDK